jgi:hypothetical protein
MNCPRCSLVCPDDSHYCDCGYRFVAHVPPSLCMRRVRSFRSTFFRSLLIIWTLAVAGPYIFLGLAFRVPVFAALSYVGSGPFSRAYFAIPSMLVPSLFGTTQPRGHWLLPRPPLWHGLAVAAFVYSLLSVVIAVGIGLKKRNTLANQSLDPYVANRASHGLKRRSS